MGGGDLVNNAKVTEEALKQILGDVTLTALAAFELYRTQTED